MSISAKKLPIINPILAQKLPLFICSLFANKFNFDSIFANNENPNKMRTLIKISDWEIIYGDNNLTYSAYGGNNKYIRECFKHDEYDEKSAYYDVAILDLEDKFTFQTRKARPVCLPTKPNSIDNRNRDMVRVMGWGGTSNDEIYNQDLHVAKINIFSHRYKKLE